MVIATTSLWPWLALAGLGALHGLSPVSGWPLAAAWALRSRQSGSRHGRGPALRALLPLGLGHAASVGLVAAALAMGLALDRVLLQWIAGGLCAVAVLLHLSGHGHRLARASAGHAGLALWSFMTTTAQGAGLMLVPALMPLCLGAAGARPAGDLGDASGPLLQALAAVAVHSAAMLLVTGLVAAGVCRGVGAGWRWRRPPPHRGGSQRAMRP